MNPSLKLALVLIISLEISFTHRLVANLVLVVVGLALLLATKPSRVTCLRLLLIPAIPAGSLALTVGAFTPAHDWFFAGVLASRIYVYVLLGSAVSLSTDPLDLARSLEQNCHLPAKFAYGTLAAINLMPKIVQAIKTIKAAGQMRNTPLSFWSPTLYFKAVLSAISWSEQLAMAMESHSFQEDQPRSFVRAIPMRGRDWAIFGGGLVAVQLLLIVFP